MPISMRENLPLQSLGEIPRYLYGGVPYIHAEKEDNSGVRLDYLRESMINKEIGSKLLKILAPAPPPLPVGYILHLRE